MPTSFKLRHVPLNKLDELTTALGESNVKETDRYPSWKNGFMTLHFNINDQAVVLEKLEALQLSQEEVEVR